MPPLGSQRRIFEEEEPLFIQAQKAEQEAQRPFISRFGEELGRSAFELLPGGTLPAKAPLKADPLTLGLEAAGAVPILGGLAKPLKKAAPKIFGGLKNLSTKLLEKFRGMPESITEQEFNTVLNRAKKEGIRQADEQLITSSIVKKQGKINLPKTAAKVEEQLVPLTPTPVKSPRYSSVGADFIGDGKYGEIVYQSPIKTSAGDIHFSRRGIVEGDPTSEFFPNYFSHIRYEDLADGKTRKILETQSDLMQKENFAREADPTAFSIMQPDENIERLKKRLGGQKAVDRAMEARKAEVSKLSAYESNNPLAHLRTFREEVKRAAKDGKDTLLIPSGETAMKIEGLGVGTQWNIVRPGKIVKIDLTQELLPDNMKVGQIISRFGDPDHRDDWIITDVLGDGKFKAISVESLKKYDLGAENTLKEIPSATYLERIKKSDPEYVTRMSETFDISGKVDTQHFVYKLNEEAIPREARKIGLEVMGKIKRDNGEWWKIKIPKERAKLPVEAFGVAPFIPLPTERREENRRELFEQPLFINR